MEKSIWGLSRKYPASHILWKVETVIEEDIKNIVHKTMTPQSPSKLALWDLTQFPQPPLAAPLHSPESHWWFEISSFSKVVLVLGKARSHRVPNLGCRGAEPPGWFDVLPKNCMRSDVIMKLPITVTNSCGLWNHWNREERSSFTQNLMQICCSTCSVILNAMTTQCTCSLNVVYCPHWLVQWSHHCSRMCIPVHSPGLPGDINAAQTILVILTTAGLFLDRPRPMHIRTYYLEC